MLIVEIGKISGDSRFEHLAYHTIFSLLARVSGFLYRLLFQKFFRCQLSSFSRFLVFGKIVPFPGEICSIFGVFNQKLL